MRTCHIIDQEELELQTKYLRVTLLAAAIGRIAKEHAPRMAQTICAGWGTRKEEAIILPHDGLLRLGHEPAIYETRKRLNNIYILRTYASQGLEKER